MVGVTKIRIEFVLSNIIFIASESNEYDKKNCIYIIMKK